MFQLKETKVLIVSINGRAEKHGDRTEPAFDIMCEAALASTVLDMFDKELRATLYKKAEEAAQPDLVDQADPEALTALRFPKLDALKWDLELGNYKVRVSYGIGGKSDIQLSDCKVDGFKFTAQQGGTVLTRFRAIAHPETADVGRLYELVQNSIEMDVTPPPPENVHELFDEDVSAPAKGGRGKKKPVLAPAEAWPFPTKA